MDGIFHAYLYVAGYGYSTTVGSCWLAPLVEAGEGVNLSFIFKRQPKEKILPKIAQTTMVNRSRMRDVGDTRQDFEELDSAISSGLYLKDTMNRSGEDFYYMHTLIEVTAEDAETPSALYRLIQFRIVVELTPARRAAYRPRIGPERHSSTSHVLYAISISFALPFPVPHFSLSALWGAYHSTAVLNF